MELTRSTIHICYAADGNIAADGCGEGGRAEGALNTGCRCCCCEGGGEEDEDARELRFGWFFEWITMTWNGFWILLGGWSRVNDFDCVTRKKNEII